MRTHVTEPMDAPDQNARSWENSRPWTSWLITLDFVWKEFLKQLLIDQYFWADIMRNFQDLYTVENQFDDNNVPLSVSFLNVG
jgi:hypothetical protein